MWQTSLNIHRMSNNKTKKVLGNFNANLIWFVVLLPFSCWQYAGNRVALTSQVLGSQWRAQAVLRRSHPGEWSWRLDWTVGFSSLEAWKNPLWKGNNSHQRLLSCQKCPWTNCSWGSDAIVNVPYCVCWVSACMANNNQHICSARLLLSTVLTQAFLCKKKEKRADIVFMLVINM